MPLKAMIIDDEPFVRNDLKNMIEAHNLRCRESRIQVSGEAGTIAEAKALLLEKKPDLVFLDVMLRGGTGFDLVPFIDAETEIIFITAHDEYAIRAFEVNALDYLLKPVNPTRLTEALIKIRKNQKAENTTNSLNRSEIRLRPDDCVMIRQDSSRFFVNVHEIVAISSIGGNYVSVFTRKNDKFITRKTMKDWEETLPKSIFLRIHRSAIVNIQCTRHLTQEKDGSCRLMLENLDEPFIVSRRMSHRVKELIDKSA